MARRAPNGRYEYADDRICVCGHDSYEHRGGVGRDVGDRPCDSPTDTSCTCPRFRPRKETTR